MASIRINSDLLNDPTAQRLSPAAFREAFLRAARGELSELDGLVKRGRPKPSGPAWARLRAQVFARDDYTCQYCGVRGVRLECDHVVPASRGGADDLDNLTTACRPCNQAKRDKTPEEWSAVRGAH